MSIYILNYISLWTILIISLFILICLIIKEIISSYDRKNIYESFKYAITLDIIVYINIYRSI